MNPLTALYTAHAALNQNATFPADIALARRVIAEAINAPANPAEDFADYVESRRDLARDPVQREFWHRLLGTVRKAATL